MIRITAEQKAALKVVNRDPQWFRYGGEYRLIQAADISADPLLARAFVAAWLRRPSPFPPECAA